MGLTLGGVFVVAAVLIAGCSSEPTGQADVCTQLAAARQQYFDRVAESSLMSAAAGLLVDLQAIREHAAGTDLEVPARVAAATSLQQVDELSLEFARECARLGLLNEGDVSGAGRRVAGG